MESRKISKKSIIVFAVILLLLFSNVVCFLLYLKERSDLRHSIMPVTQGDYYQEQLALVNNYELLRGKTGNYEMMLELAEERANEEADKAVNYNTAYYERKTDVPFISQNPDYPTGCESVSAVMLLQSYGIDITVDEFVNNYLKKNIIYSKDGDRYGPDPKSTYAGDPTSRTGGFGIFEPGIKLAVEKVLYDKAGSGINYNVYGSENKEPLSIQTAKGLPLVIWATTNYEPVDEMWTWQSYDKKYTYTYPKHSHTVVVTGADDKYYYVNDPLQQEGNTRVDRKTLEDCFDSLGRQSVRIEMYDITELSAGAETEEISEIYNN